MPVKSFVNFAKIISTVCTERTCAFLVAGLSLSWCGLELAAPGGGVAEWSMATVLKTVNPQGFVGSNPTPSAIVTHKLRGY